MLYHTANMPCLPQANDVADAMVYLSSRKLIHCDIACRNVCMAGQVFEIPLKNWAASFDVTVSLSRC